MVGRPREFDRDEALERARDAFWLRGYEGTSMADLVAVLGLTPPRIYAAFGSKEDLFREAVSLYRAREGRFAVRALEEEPTARCAIERMLRDGVKAFLLPGKPRGCMVVSAATNCSKSNDAVMDWLTEHRRTRIDAVVDRLRKAVDDGELRADADVQALGDYFATVLNGMAILARDGVPKDRLLALIPPALRALDTVTA
ncbi:TetR/AcrR family transcriptional regulator [Rhodospirillaceae bacterium SYSU D60014]|uniref:TetR/AcrR family transcriptional regulator n=1 Tax=Virgifigura deserti TaxID=2268457 RepID=UPI000E66D5B4